MSYNRVIIAGNLGKDAEIRHSPSGSTVANFSVATTEKWKNKDGERQESTEWHRVALWGKQAEAIGGYLTKGKQVLVEGSIHTRKWEDRDGNDRYTTEIKARNVVLLSRSASSGDGQADDRPAHGAPELTEDDIPF